MGEQDLILVGVDGSESARAVLDFASGGGAQRRADAGRGGLRAAGLLGAHLRERPGMVVPPSRMELAGWTASAVEEAVTAAVRDAGAAARGVRLEVRVVRRRTAAVLLDHSDHLDLLVVGRHGRGAVVNACWGRWGWGASCGPAAPRRGAGAGGPRRCGPTTRMSSSVHGSARRQRDRPQPPSGIRAPPGPRRAARAGRRRRARRGRPGRAPVVDAHHHGRRLGSVRALTPSPAAARRCCATRGPRPAGDPGSRAPGSRAAATRCGTSTTSRSRWSAGTSRARPCPCDWTATAERPPRRRTSWTRSCSAAPPRWASSSVAAWSSRCCG